MASGTLKRGCLTGAAAFLLAATPLPGIGLNDPRIPADDTRPPWSAVALLLIPSSTRCTAVAVAPHWVVTAAHCVYIRAVGHTAPPSSIHLAFGYRSGDYARLLIPDIIRLPEGADPAATQVRSTDIAFLHIPETLADLLPPLDTATPPGTATAMGGFGQDRAERLVIDPACTLLAPVQAADHYPVLAHTCSGTRGVSGGALVVQVTPGTWRLAAMPIDAQLGQSGGYAIPATRLAALLAALPP